MQDEPLTPGEQQAFAELPREMTPPAGLEDRVVEALGARRSSGRRGSSLWLGRVAATLVIFLGGFAAGRATGATSAPPVTAPAGEQYLLLLYGGTPASAGEEASRVEEYAAWARAEREAGRLVGAEKLQHTYMLLGAPAGGPVDPSEPSGFFLIRAATATEAAEAARSCPHLQYGGTVVVRPVEHTN